MKEKQVTMTLELAKQMLGKDEAMDMLIKQNFSDEELGIKPKLPKKVSDIKQVSGYEIRNGCYTRVDYRHWFDFTLVLPTQELAEAVIALCWLLYIRDIYNDGWQPDWCNSLQRKYVIATDLNKIVSFDNNTISRSIAFKTEELRDEFLANFKDLLEIAKPLL